MPWMMAAAVVGSSLLGASSASSAADTQAAAADRAGGVLAGAGVGLHASHAQSQPRVRRWPRLLPV